MKQRQPRSTQTDTILHYTTLFRSARKQKAAAHPTSAHPPSHIKKAAESPVSAQTIPGTQAMTVSIRRREVAILLLFFSADRRRRSEEHTSELQSLMRISYAVFCLQK